jgi:hypothetical protein
MASNFIAYANGAASGSVWKATVGTNTGLESPDPGDGSLYVASTTSVQHGGQSAPGAGANIEGILINVKAATVSGTFTVGIYENNIYGDWLPGTTVTVDVADLPASGNDWVYFEFAAPVAITTGMLCSIGFTSSVDSTVRVSTPSGALSNIGRLVRTDATGSPTSGDTGYIAGEYTAAATYTARVVTGTVSGVTLTYGWKGFSSQPTTTWTGGGDGIHTNDTDNWDNGVPDASTVAVFVGSDDIVVSTGFESFGMDWSAFTGSVDGNSCARMKVWGGDVIFGNGMTFVDGYFYLEWQANGTYTGGTATKPSDLELGAISGATIDFTESTHITALLGNGASAGNANIHGHTLTLDCSGAGGGMLLDHAGALLFSAGAKIVVNEEAGQGTTIAVDPAQSLPAIELNGSTGTTIAGSFTGQVDCVSFLATVPGGTLVNWALSVAGSNAAHGCTVTTSDFSGGTTLDASDGCTDGGGNTNVDFVATSDHTRGVFVFH